MGFPYTHQFLGSVHSKWRLVGNAVCPSVSRALASEVLSHLNIKHSNRLKLNETANLENIINLNNFKEKVFDNQPKRNKNSRFRRHPIKAGNMTVTLSNYNISSNSKAEGLWFTSVQYGTGLNFKNQEVKDGFYRTIEPLLIENNKAKKFIKIINNGFSKKIGNSKMLQNIYENQVSRKGLLDPTQIVEKIAELIHGLDSALDFDFTQENNLIFKYKKTIPFKQILALYAINKITSEINKK
jgi:DNA (cytosine-5)-methyltransferase 1